MTRQLDYLNEFADGNCHHDVSCEGQKCQDEVVCCHYGDHAHVTDIRVKPNDHHGDVSDTDD